MSLADKLQEVEDARAKKLLSDQEAASQRAAILSEQTKPVALFSASGLTIRKPRRPRCCTPLRCSKFLHIMIGFAAVSAFGLGIAIQQVYYTDVWVTCSGAESNLLNQSHPFFCDRSRDHHDHHRHHDDDDDYYTSTDGSGNSGPEWACGNERFEFTWDNIKYSTYNSTTEISWSDLLDLGELQAFPQSIGSFTGADNLWTQSYHAIKSLKTLGHIISPFGLITFIFMVVMVRRTFYRLHRFESPKRWMGFISVFGIVLGLAIAITAVNSHMKISNTHSHHDGDDDDHSSHHKRSHFAPAWASHYPEQYGCQASPFPYSMALSIVGIWIFGSAMALAFVRMACLRCRTFELDEANQQFLVNPRFVALNNVDPVNYGGAHFGTGGVIPPAYVQSSKGQEMTASFA